MHRLRVAVAAVAAAATLASAAPPARADTALTVRVEFYYGAAVAGGAGLFIWISGAWQMGFRDRVPVTALLELDRGRLRAGIPLPAPAAPIPGVPDGASPGVVLDLVRFRF